MSARMAQNSNSEVLRFYIFPGRMPAEPLVGVLGCKYSHFRPQIRLGLEQEEQAVLGTHDFTG